MRIVSTRNSKNTEAFSVSFKEAVFKGLAPDGGLYHVADNPDLKKVYAGFGAETGFNAMAEKVTEALFHDEFSTEAARRVVERAFTFAPVLRRLDASISLLELFHGPSFAFKDFGASFLASVMEEYLRNDARRAVILTATSGDTGSAVARAFYGKKNIDVVILYPSGRVSPLQEKQLTTLGGNVAALEVKGSFDDCQRMVKEVFVDAELSNGLNLTSANSINLGRLIPQAFYYMYAYYRVKSPDRPLYFCVPSGNFGNLTAGVLAWSWGLPAAGFIAATNVNDVVPEYLKSGRFTPRPSVQTYSNAMDVGNPSNFERLSAIFRGDWKAMKGIISEEVVTDRDTLATIARYYREKQLFIDPHTAVGCLAAERFRDRSGIDADIVTLSTAHPGKFLEVVEEATGIQPPLPPKLAEVLLLPKQAEIVGNTTGDLKDYLRRRFT